MSSGEDFLITIVAFILGLLFLRQGFSLLRRELSRRYNPGVRTEGAVIAVEERHDEGTTYSVTVRFTDRDGTERAFVDDVQTSWPRPSIGDTSPVFYCPLDPARAWVARPIALTVLVLIPLLLGVLVLGAVCVKLAL